MHLTSFGAAQTVTGSKHLIEFENQKILLDCGLFQGRRQIAYEKNSHFPAKILTADAALLSHAHIDHAGSLPTLAKNGYQKPIFATPATRDLAEIMLADAAYIQAADVKFLAKKKWPVQEPLYTQADVQAVLRLFVTKNYDEWFAVAPGCRACFREAGHILGSAQIELEFEIQGKKKRLGFTGDLGRSNLPILRDPAQMQHLDYLITESTYANREHAELQEVSAELLKIVERTAARGGKIIIPAFSVERTQEIIYLLHELYLTKKLKFDLPIFVDSPLAINATAVFRAHRNLFDAAAFRDFIEKGKGPFTFSQIEYVRDAERSKELNAIRAPMIIISASGMCEAGRVLHHLRNNITEPKNTVLIIGFQAEGTLGRRLVEKNPLVKIFGKPVPRRCQVTVLNAFSAHAGAQKLLENIKLSGAKKIFCVHGEEHSLEKFTQKITRELNCEAGLPREGKRIKIN